MSQTCHADQKFPAALTATTAGEMVAILPSVLGHHVTQSVIAVCFMGDSPDALFIARRDLPATDQTAPVAARFAQIATAQDTRKVILVIVAPRDRDEAATALPRTDVLQEFARALAAFDIPVDYRIWAAGTMVGSEWQCYDCLDEGIIDLIPSLAGHRAPSDSRDDIAASLAPVDSATLARRARLLATTDRPQRTNPEHVASLRAAIHRAGDGILPTSDTEIVDLAMALCEHIVRDQMLDLPADDHAAAEHLWSHLARNTPAPERAEPACLLGFWAWTRGAGVIANIALDNASQADPEHRFTAMLLEAMTYIPPARLSAIGRKGARDARACMNEEAD